MPPKYFKYQAILRKNSNLFPFSRSKI